MQYGNRQFDYLVKWRELVYEQATWERDDFDAPGYEDAVIKYWMHRYRTLTLILSLLTNSTYIVFCYWRLVYDSCFSDKLLNETIPKHIAKKLAARRGGGGEEKERKKGKAKAEKPTTDLRKKYEEQPPFISETGGTLHAYQVVKNRCHFGVVICSL